MFYLALIGVAVSIFFHLYEKQSNAPVIEKQTSAPKM